MKRFLPVLVCLPLLVLAQTTKAPAPKAAVKPVAVKAVTPASTTLPPRAAGNPNAPILLEVFSDFQCPGCRSLYMLSLRRIIDEYCATGKVYLVHHDFPLPMHPYSRQAAKWAIAAATIGKYETVTEAIFTKQDNWSANGNIEPIVAAVLSPQELKQLKDNMNSRGAEIEAAIASDVALGTELKVAETPSVKVTYKGTIVAPLTPAKFTYAVLKRFLDDQLSK